MKRGTLGIVLLGARVVWSAGLTTEYAGGTITGSPSHSSFPPARAFDGLPATDTAGRWLSTGTNGWVQYQFPGSQALAVGSYKIWNQTVHSVTTRAPRNFHLSGSNDGSAWTVLDTRTGQAGWTDAEVRTYTLAEASAPFAYVRLTITANNGASDYTGLSELEFFAPSTDPPGVASGPNPANASTGAIPSGLLRWSPGLNASAHRVYLGATEALGEDDFLGMTAGAEIAYGPLPGSATYFWRVDGQNAYGVSTGVVWQFTTVGIPPAHVAYEGFEAYAPGPLAGTGAADAGWTAPWTATTSAVAIVAAAMRYESGEVLVDGGTKAVRYPYLPGDTRPLSRAFEAIGYGPAYFSMLVHGIGMQNDVHSFALRDSTFDGGGDGIAESGGFNFGRGGGDTGTPAFLAELSYGNNARTRVLTPVVASNDQTYFVVVRLRRAGDSNEYESADVLVNPTSATEPSTGWTTAANATCKAMAMRLFILRVAVMDEGDWVQLDEVRIGTTYEAVVPKVPPLRSTLITIW